MMKNKLWRWLLIISVLLVLLVPKFFGKKEGSAAGNGKPGMQGPLPVQGMLIKSSALNNVVKTSGTLLADEQVELQAETNGKIVGLYFEEGARVSKGKLLLKINDAEWQAMLRKAESRLRLAEEMERRQKEMLKKEGISQTEYDQALNELNTAKADVAQAKEQIRKTEVIAPFDGVIGLKYISEGAYVTPNARIAGFHKIDRIKIEFSVPERYAAQVQSGQTIFFKTEGSETLREAKIYAVEPRIDELTRNLQLRAVCANNGTLYPGAFVQVQVPLKEVSDAVMIPTEAVIPILKGQKVFLAKGDSVLEVKIKTGIRNDQFIQVTEGLKSGDTLITSALMQLKQGAKITLRSLK
jgi:membrane fusion protein (multidrug efflux system)